MEIVIYPKVNIFLKILGALKGYHSINSRFVTAYSNLYDVMYISASSKFAIRGNFDCVTQDNLIYKAKVALQDYLSASRRNQEALVLEFIKVEVQKSIPIGAGLGGGSANAGAFLAGVNDFFKLGLDRDELVSIAQNLGSDVAFFATRFKSANVSGRGEIIEQIKEEPMRFKIYTPDINCSTREVYENYAKGIRRHKFHYSKPSSDWFAKSSRELLDLNLDREVMNDLFVSACEVYPKLLGINRELGDKWYFSGSGSSFFTLEA